MVLWTIDVPHIQHGACEKNSTDAAIAVLMAALASMCPGRVLERGRGFVARTAGGSRSRAEDQESGRWLGYLPAPRAGNAV